VKQSKYYQVKQRKLMIYSLWGLGQ